MLTVRSIKELSTACRWLLNYKDTSEKELILRWIERASSYGVTDENNLKLELFEILLALKKTAGKYGFIDRNTGEIVDTIYDDSLPVVFKDKNFWFTGKAFYGSRKKCEDAVAARGGTALENKKPDYIMVGLFAGTFFCKDYYSNKIEHALLLKTDRFVESNGIRISADIGQVEKTNSIKVNVTPQAGGFVRGYPISIVSEEHWVKYL